MPLVGTKLTCLLVQRRSVDEVYQTRRGHPFWSVHDTAWRVAKRNERRERGEGRLRQTPEVGGTLYPETRALFGRAQNIIYRNVR